MELAFLSAPKYYNAYFVSDVPYIFARFMHLVFYSIFKFFINA